MKTKNILLIAGLAAIGVYLVKRQATKAAAAVGEAIDPTSDENIFYQGANAVVDVFDDGSDNDSDTLGTWLYGLINDDDLVPGGGYGGGL